MASTLDNSDQETTTVISGKLVRLCKDWYLQRQSLITSIDGLINYTVLCIKTVCVIVVIGG